MTARYTAAKSGTISCGSPTYHSRNQSLAKKRREGLGKAISELIRHLSPAHYLHLRRLSCPASSRFACVIRGCGIVLSKSQINKHAPTCVGPIPPDSSKYHRLLGKASLRNSPAPSPAPAVSKAAAPARESRVQVPLRSRAQAQSAGRGPPPKGKFVTRVPFVDCYIDASRPGELVADDIMRRHMLLVNTVEGVVICIGCCTTVNGERPIQHSNAHRPARLVLAGASVREAGELLQQAIVRVFADAGRGAPPATSDPPAGLFELPRDAAGRPQPRPAVQGYPLYRGFACTACGKAFTSQETGRQHVRSQAHAARTSGGVGSSSAVGERVHEDELLGSQGDGGRLLATQLHAVDQPDELLEPATVQRYSLSKCFANRFVWVRIYMLSPVHASNLSALSRCYVMTLRFCLLASPGVTSCSAAAASKLIDGRPR